jgi:hypothetical protein
MKHNDYLGPKRYESQFDMTEGIKKYYPHLIEKSLNAKDCECDKCGDASGNCVRKKPSK